MAWKIKTAKGLNICKLFVFLLIISNCECLHNSTKAKERLAIATRDDCHRINRLPDWKCELHANKYEITCLKPEKENDEKLKVPNIVIRVPPTHKFVDVECINATDTMHKLPYLNVGTVPLVKLINCPLPANVSFARILSRLNITNVSTFIYTSNNSNFTLKHFQLENLPSLNQLTLNLKNSVTFEGDLFTDLTHVEKITLRTHQPNLNERLFESLRNLMSLSLAVYNVTKLPDNIFSYMERLTELDLGPSDITHLQKAIFENLTSINKLTINGNNIETIEPNIFDNLSNLSTFCLNSNRIEQLPAALFAQTKKLTKFSLANNRVPLRFLPADLLANLPVLKSVTLCCGLENVDGNLFVNSTLIENIDLEDNKLLTLPENLLLHQINLLEIDLSENLLSELPEKLFTNNAKLKILKLTNNRIKQITSEIFKPLLSLEQLIMDKNNLTTIDINAFVGLNKLKTLKLQHNRITLNESLVDSPFSELKSLEVLNLCNNNIQHAFFENNFGLPLLKRLDICFNNISSIDLNKLQELSQRKLLINLLNNRLETIFYEDYRNFSLQTSENQEIGLQLDVRDNPINCDCKVLGLLKYVKGDFSCQQPNSLSKTPLSKVLPEQLFCELETCALGCKCFEFPHVKTISIECQHKNEVNLPDLKISLSDYSEDSVVEFIEINLENNNLAKLPVNLTLREYDKIKTLKLAGNKLEAYDLENLPRSLLHLDLRNNSFKTFDNAAVLEHFEKNNTNKSLQLSGNPFQCDCTLQALFEFVEKHYKTLNDPSKIRCFFPDNSSMAFSQFKFAEICNVDLTLIISLSVLAVFILLLMISALLYLKYNVEIKIWLYAHKMLLWFITEAELDKDKTYDAFISYSSKDEKFVVEHLVPQLENGKPPFKVCVHYRNFLVGASIPSNIASAVENSRRTIIVLSKNFLESDWALHEFRSAHLAALDEKKPKVIVILYGDIGNIDDIDSELQVYLKTKTYLTWNDPKFWDRLRFAMPHSNAQSRNGITLQPIQNGYAIVNGTVRSQA